MSVGLKDYIVTIAVYNLINTILILLFFGPITATGFLVYIPVMIFKLLLCDKLDFKYIFWFVDKR